MAFWLDKKATLLSPAMAVSPTTHCVPKAHCVPCPSCPCSFDLDFQVTEMWEMRLRQGGQSSPLLHWILVTECHQADPLCGSVNSHPHSLPHGTLAT